MGVGLQLKTLIARGLGLTDARLYAFLGAGQSYSGKHVTIDGAMQLDAVWACVRLLAQTIATLPLFMYKRVGSNENAKAPDHPLYRILHDSPNADMTATEFWEAMVSCVLLWGNSFAAIERGSNGAITALTPMRPDRITVRRDRDGFLVYVYNWMSVTREFQEEEVFHVKGFSLDGLNGLSPVALARHNLGAAMAAEEAAGAIFKNGMRPSGYMQAPAYLTDPQRQMAEKLLEKFQGSQNTGRVPLLEGGWDFKQLTIPPEDAQLLQTRSFHVEQICRWFDCPPIMIYHNEKTTAWGTGMEQMMLWFLTFSLRPHLKRIEQAISKKLLTASEQDKFFAEFNVDALLRTDSSARATLFGALAQNGLRTRNELRAIDNMPPLPGGDDLTVQSNLLPVADLGIIAKIPADKLVQPGADVASPQGTSSNA